MGIYGRCNGGALGLVTTDLSSSYYVVSPSQAAPGDTVTHTFHLRNAGTGLALFGFSAVLPAGLDLIEASLNATQGEISAQETPSQTTITWSGCVPPEGYLALTHDTQINTDYVALTTLVSHAALGDLITGDLLHYQVPLTVEPTPEPTHYSWAFTLTPTGISTVNIPIPEEIAGGLLSRGARRLILFEGELPPFLAMGETDWFVSGMVISPGFLPFISVISSSATYAALNEQEQVQATLTVTIQVAQAETSGFPGMPGGEEPDRDYDTVPDSVDLCPDVPGDPNDPVSPGCPKYGEDEDYYEEEPDSDGDGIPDYYDLCPHEPGPWDEDRPGCPAEE